VAKKSKTETEKQADSKGADPTARGANDSVGTEEKATDAVPKPRRKKAAPKKRTVRATKRATSGKASASAPIYEPSDEEIRLRAYFIAERRIQLSLQGDSDHDWIEARRQLIEEAGPASS